MLINAWFPNTFVFGRWISVKVQDPIDHKVLLDLVVPLPVPHDVRLDEVPDMPDVGLEGGGEVWGQHKAEREVVDAGGQARASIKDCLLLDVGLMVPVVIRHRLRVGFSVTISSCHSPMKSLLQSLYSQIIKSLPSFLPLNSSLSNKLNLNFPEVLRVTQINQDLTMNRLSRKVG